MQLVSFVSHTVSFLTVIAQVGIIIFLVAWFNQKKSWAQALIRLVGQNGLWIGLVVTAGGMIISLFFSQVARWLPCELCWLQRVFLYPQVILFGMAIMKKDNRIAPYCLSLSVVGGLIALYQYYFQLGGVSLLPCSQGFGASCLTKYTNEFGYITIPMMSLTAFLLIIAAMTAVKQTKKV